MDGNSPENRDLLSSLGLTEDQQDSFFDHAPVVYSMRTQTKLGVGMIRLIDEKRLRHGIVEIEDPGNGIRLFGQYRAKTLDLAKNLGLSEVELFGAAIINLKLKEMLSRRGFEPRVEAIPDDLDEELKEELGHDGVMEILTKTFSVQEYLARQSPR